MRTEKSIKNGIVAIITNILTVIIGFVTQSIFINALGKSYLGINGLFNNIIAMLSVADLGLGTAIIFNLYKPIAEKNIEKIKSLMMFYKKCYRVIAIVVLILGVCVIPFLKYMVKDVAIPESILLIYMMFLIDTVISYLLSYKRSLLYANQENYYVNIVHIGYLIIGNFLMALILIFFKNYYLYLIIKIIIRFLENLAISIIANKKYVFLKEKDAEKIDKTTYKDIIKRVKAMINHKVGAFVVMGTDNILIATILRDGINYVGLYSNYSMVITAVTNLLGQVISSITASIGNLIATSDKEKNYSIFKNVLYINFLLAIFGTIGILLIMKDFIVIWIGEEFLLPQIVLIVLCANFFLRAMRNTYDTFKAAAGICYEDRFVPIMEAVINIVVSIILGNIFGIVGIFLGTVLSNLLLFLYSYPKFVYKFIFQKNKLCYYKDLCKYLVIGALVIILSYILGGIFTYKITNSIVKIIIELLITIIVPNLIIFIITHKTEEYYFFVNIIKSLIAKKTMKGEEK